MPARDVVEQNKKKFPPGTPAAAAEGCTCSDVSNHYGKGYMGRSWTWLIRDDCPLHYCASHSIKPQKRSRSEDEE